MPGELTRAQSLWFTEEVRKIRAEVLKQDVPPLEAFEMFDVETDVPVGAQEFGSDMITQFGVADVIATASDDINFAEVGIYRSTHPVIALGIGYRWSHMEALQAAASRKVPRRLRGTAARDIMLQALNDIAINGKADYGVQGFLTYPGVPRHTMSTNFSSDDTAADIIQDMLDVFIRPITATKGIEKPTHFAIPLTKFLHISTTPRSTTSGSDTTILEFFLKQAQGITGRSVRVFGSWMFDESGVNKCAVWSRGRTATNKIVIPGNMRFSQLDVQRRNYEFHVPCLGVTGGWYTEYPLRAVIGEFSG